MARDMENNRTLFERDTARLNAELEKARIESKQAQKENEKMETELTKL